MTLDDCKIELPGQLKALVNSLINGAKSRLHCEYRSRFRLRGSRKAMGHDSFQVHRPILKLLRKQKFRLRIFRRPAYHEFRNQAMNRLVSYQVSRNPGRFLK